MIIPLGAVFDTGEASLLATFLGVAWGLTSVIWAEPSVGWTDGFSPINFSSYLSCSWTEWTHKTSI